MLSSLIGNSRTSDYRTLQWNSSIVAMHWGMKLNRGVALSQGVICTKRVHLGLSEVAFIERCPRVRGGLYKGFHCIMSFIERLSFLGSQKCIGMCPCCLICVKSPISGY